MRKVFPAGPGTSLKIGVTIHSDLAALRKAYRGMTGLSGDTILAFCHRGEVVDEVIAELHFNRAEMPLSTIVHETCHAVLVLARYMRLNLEDNYAEEIVAEASEAIVANALAARRESKAEASCRKTAIKVFAKADRPQSGARPRSRGL